MKVYEIKQQCNINGRHQDLCHSSFTVDLSLFENIREYDTVLDIYFHQWCIYVYCVTGNLSLNSTSMVCRIRGNKCN